MVKTLRCSSCGAGLNFTPGQPNVICEYCNSFVRVSDDRPAQFESEVIIGQIAQIWPRVRNDSFTSEYEAIKELISKNKYAEASNKLDRILEKDQTQARAWFYKSLLPILDETTILFKGSYIDIVKVSHITNRTMLREYLKSCGLSLWRQKEFLDYYRSTDFLYEQQIKFLDKAIKYASNKERADFFQKAKDERIKIQTQMLRHRRFATVGLLLLLSVVVAGSFIIVWNILKGNWNV